MAASVAYCVTLPLAAVLADRCSKVGTAPPPCWCITLCTAPLQWCSSCVPLLSVLVPHPGHAAHGGGAASLGVGPSLWSDHRRSCSHWYEIVNPFCFKHLSASFLGLPPCAGMGTAFANACAVSVVADVVDWEHLGDYGLGYAVQVHCSSSLNGCLRTHTANAHSAMPTPCACLLICPPELGHIIGILPWPSPLWSIHYSHKF